MIIRSTSNITTFSYFQGPMLHHLSLANTYFHYSYWAKIMPLTDSFAMKKWNDVVYKLQQALQAVSWS